jgi:hypothetical protein
MEDITNSMRISYTRYACIQMHAIDSYLGQGTYCAYRVFVPLTVRSAWYRHVYPQRMACQLANLAIS